MAYSPFKMKGHTLPGIKQRKSPVKNRITDTSGMDKDQVAAATSHNDAHASGKDPHGSTKKSPAKFPIAAIPAIVSAVGAVGGMMKKKEE